MFKTVILFAIFSVALCAPAADPAPKAKPGLVAAAYTAPVVAAPLAAAPFAYSAAYTAPLGYVAPAVLNAGYTAYSPYTGAVVAV